MDRLALTVMVSLITQISSMLDPAVSAEIAAVPMVAGFDRFARHDEIDTAAGGRLLISELSCAACHQAKDQDLQPKLGPKLEGVADRVQHDWIAKYLASPQAAKPGTTMPDVLAGLSTAEKPQVVAALAAFLATQHLPYPKLAANGGNPLPEEFWNSGNAEQGQQLYHTVGCIACHEPNEDQETVATEPSAIDRMLEELDPEELAEMGLDAAARPVPSVPHGDLDSKYSRKSLTFFLLNPEKVRPSGRMPSLKLKPVEAADIAAYLLREQAGTSDAKAESDNPELVNEGKQLFSQLGCVNCHTATGVEPSLKAKPLGKLAASAKPSCWNSPAKGLPHFALDEFQTSALVAAIGELKTNKPKSADRSIASHMLRLNCYACHERNKQGGVGRNRKAYFETVRHIDIGDEGRIPPSLDGVGRKLKIDWLKKVLEGSGEVRPHLMARMPKYPSTAIAPLPLLFAQADAADSRNEKQVFGRNRSLTQAGRLLLDTGCVQCHPVRGERLPGVVGIDLAEVAQRIHPSWFREFLLDPGKLKSRTRMPTFFPNGRGQDKNILNGNANLQIAALWVYLRDIKKHPLPEKIVKARSQDFELVPKDRPILLRTFMPVAGTHAIAVGFPQRVHYAFDAEHMRLAQAWREKFIDAQGTWFERMAPPANPLGDALIELPLGVPFALLKDETQAWPSKTVGYKFLGYRLDAEGVPTFLYRFRDFEIEDRIVPGKQQSLNRSITVKALSPEAEKASLWFRANLGTQLKRNQESSVTNNSGLTVGVTKPSRLVGEIRNTGKQFEWILPLDISHAPTIQLEYQW